MYILMLNIRESYDKINRKLPFLFIPFINKLIKELTKYQYKKLLITYIICFSVIGLILDCFNVNRGFSFLWLSFMYILGAYIKLYSSDFRKENIIYLLYYFICVILMWLIKNIIAILTYKIFGKVFGNTLFIVYNSPFLVIAASSLLIICSRLHFKYISKIILTLSSFTFGVYLISDQIYIRQFFITNKFINYSNEPWYLMIIKILLISVLIYLICSFIDYIRKYLFKILNVSKLAEKIERSISNIITTKLNNANS